MENLNYMVSFLLSFSSLFVFVVLCLESLFLWYEHVVLELLLFSPVGF